MSLLARFGSEVKAAIKSVPFSRSGAGGWGNFGNTFYSNGSTILNTNLPGSTYDYHTAAGVLWQNPAAAACFVALTKAFAQARPTLEKRNGDKWEKVDDHPFVTKLNTPNNFYSGEKLFGVTLISMLSHGSGFWRIDKNRVDGVGNIWFEPPVGVGATGIAPNWDDTNFIKDYSYFVDGRRYPGALRREEVVFFRHGLNPANPRLPWGPLQLAAREIATLNSGSTYTGALMRNGAAPCGLITQEGGDLAGAEPMTTEQAAAIKEQVSRNFTGENVGKPFVSNFNLKWQPMTWSPKDMEIQSVMQWPQGVVCALLGTPQIVALLPTAEQPTYENLDSSMRWWWDNTVQPLQDAFADEIETQLFPAFGLDAADYRMKWDTSNVPALREDLANKHSMLDASFKAGWMKRSEVRAQAGLETTPEDEVYAAPTAAPEAGEPEDDETPVKEAAKSIEAKAEYSDEEIAALEVDEIVAAKVLAFNKTVEPYKLNP